ncbi:MAG TPA: NAD(P)/FAD-dependent oxidoreductase [Anaerolineales bacterium]|nr:NAD(P)/FAD-dependent oxidoreductase [Anaerolineales bacterium]HLO33325.1 NAD(P)/FAD-dependent oxidoreductase [Anaerolineales bacterium]
MTSNHYEYIIIGAGHTGLVAAAYLAKTKKKVLVLERRSIIGGSVVTETFGEGFRVDAVWTGGMLRPDIIKDLKLPLPRAAIALPSFISLQPDSYHLVLDSDPAKAAESIKRFSEKDAGRWPEFVRFMNKAAHILDVTYGTIMPRLPRNFSLSEGYGLLELGLDLRLAGRKDMLSFIRALPMTAQELLEEYFESEQVRAAVAAVAIHGSSLGPMSAGTGYSLIHNWLNRGGLSHGNVGQAGEITRALASAVKSYGGEIRCEAEVKSIQVDTYACKGVVLTNGEEIFADRVISAVDPKRTFLSLVGPLNLPPEFVWKTQSIKMRGSVAKVHLLTDGQHGIPAGTVVLAPSIKYLEKAYDAAKYGEISEQPYLEVTTSGNVVSIHFQFAPYKLKNGSWDMERETIEKLAIDSLAEHFVNLKSSIVNRKSITPLDLEETYGLTEGDLNHGQLMLDQFLFMRPIPGWANHKTPIDNLYLCGSGVHGGGGVSGVTGRNIVKLL